MLQNSVAQAKMAGKEIQLSLKSQIAILDNAEKSAQGQNLFAIQQRLSAARTELAKEEDIKILAMNRAAGVQLSLAQAMRLKEAGLEYRSLTTVAAEAEAMKVAANKRAMEAVMQQEHEEAMLETVIQAERVAAAEAAAEAIKVADAEAVAAAIRDTSGALEWAIIEDEARTAAAEKEAAERIAIAKAEELAKIQAVAEGNGAKAALNVSHGHGGISGIIRESLVIIREIAMGRGLGRIGGSVTLLAQYMGVLGLAVKSTATEALRASIAASKLSKAMNAAAFAAQGTAEYEGLAAAAVAQEATAAKLAAVANIELANAMVVLRSSFFLVTGAILAIGVTAFVLWRRFERLAKAAKNLADALNPLSRKYTDLAEAQVKAAEAAKKNDEWIASLMSKHQTESELIDRKIKLLREEAKARRETMEARGVGDEELQRADREALEAEKAMMEAAQARLTLERDQAIAEEKNASAADIVGATVKDSAGRKLTLDDLRGQQKRLGEILDAAEEARRNTIIGEEHGTRQVITPIGLQTVPNYVDRAANDADVIDFKQDGKDFHMSVTEAKANFNTVNGMLVRLAADQTTLDEALNNAKSTAKEKADALARVNSDLEEVNDQLGVKKGETKHGRGRDRGEVTDRERIGLGAASSVQASILSAAMRSEQHLAQISGKIAAIQQQMQENAGSLDG